MKRIIRGMLLSLSGAALFAFAAVPSQANAMTLAEILLADGDRFDTDQNDFDIVTEAVIATGLADAAGTQELTAFLPTDKAFRILVEDLLGVSIKDEEQLFNAIVAAFGPDTVRNILLYHLVGGVVSSADVVGAGDGAQVPTLLGQSLTLDFKGKGQIRLVDAAPLRDPVIRQVDIFASNGVAHVIDRVLVPNLD